MKVHSSFFSFVLIVFISMVSLIANSQNTTTEKSIDKTKWAKIVKGKEYEEQSPSQPIEKQAPIKETPTLLYYMLYLAVAIVLLFVLYKLFGKSLFPNNKKLKKEHALSVKDLDENPMETELDRFLKEALLNKDFSLALRVYYLMALQKMHEKKYIRWKKEKTNYDYVNESLSKPYATQFQSNTFVFEYFWYGNHKLEEHEYASLSKSFIQFIDSI